MMMIIIIEVVYLKVNLLKMLFLFQIKTYEKLETVEERLKQTKEIYDNFIMKELLSHTHVSALCFICSIRLLRLLYAE